MACAHAAGAAAAESRGSYVQRRLEHSLAREEITDFVQRKSFGTDLSWDSGRAALFDKVAAIARQRQQEKEVPVVTTRWSLSRDHWHSRPVNLQPRQERGNFNCLPDVFSYQDLEANSLVVDFANRYVGGGCFGGGFVQEEQMVAQSTDFACRLYKAQEQDMDVLEPFEALSYGGVHMDAWWSREAAERKEGLAHEDIQARGSEPLTILAVDAPVMGGQATYENQKQPLEMLARKVMLIFEVAAELQSPVVLTGLLGGGAFRNNRPLVLLLHLLLQPPDNGQQVRFHYPVFWSFCHLQKTDLEERILDWGDRWLDRMRAEGIQSLGDAINVIYGLSLPTSQNDQDLFVDDW